MSNIGTVGTHLKISNACALANEFIIISLSPVTILTIIQIVSTLLKVLKQLEQVLLSSFQLSNLK